MSFKKIWINLSITNLCIVAALGLLMRSKMVFNIPWIDYNRLVDTHGHFAFMGWVTLALVTLMIFELPGMLYKKKIYRFLLSSIFICSWGTLFTGPFQAGKVMADYISIIYILVTYVLLGLFARDIMKTQADRTVKLLSISSLIYLVISSIGPFMLSYLFAVKSLNAVLYRDALFGYLHLQYNGFFTLAVFALAINKVIPAASARAEKNTYRFAVFLSLSVIPSMFLTFLWYQNVGFRIVALIGCILLLLSFIWFIKSTLSLVTQFKMIHPSIRYMIVLSVSAFMVKIILQSFTLFDKVNVLVFGNRPMIMCFLHLVFLGFVTLFLVAYFVQKGMLNMNKIISSVALIVFTSAVLINEILLMLQGLGTILIASSPFFPWYLWVAGILLLLGALLIAIARIRTKQV